MKQSNCITLIACCSHKNKSQKRDSDLNKTKNNSVPSNTHSLSHPLQQ